MRKIADMRTAQVRGSLSQYVHSLSLEKGLSPADIERRTQGHASYSLIAGLAAGDYENVRWETLRALAKGLGVAEERLFAVAIGAANEEFQESDFLTLHNKYHELSADHQSAMGSLLQLLHREIARLQGQQNGNRNHQPLVNATPANGKRLVEEKENFQQYVLRIMKEKRLTLQDVAQCSQQSISKGYLCNLLNNHSCNPTIEKIKALAVGLGVSPQEIFAVLEVRSMDENRSFQNSLFAALYCKYKMLSRESKKEIHLLLSLIDREIDKRQMQQLRHSVR